MKLIIAGSRSIDIDFDLIDYKLEEFKLTPTEVVSGGAIGPDLVGAYWAKANNIPLKMFLPDWRRLGKRAGTVRNRDMGDYADALIAFWDGKSRGTKHMIDYMEQINKPAWVVVI